MVHKTFNSKTASDYLELKAPYYNAIEPTKVYFEEEKISVSVDSLGHIEFYDSEERSLGSVDVPVDKDPSKYGHSAQYGTVKCGVEGGNVCLQMPVYGWEDNYPHCDGESDRWDRYTARWFSVVLDSETREIKIIDK